MGPGPGSPAATGAARVMGDCGVYRAGRRVPGSVPLRGAARAGRVDGGFVWVGLQQASAADIEEVAHEFGLPALAVEDAVRAHQRPKLEIYGDVVFVVLKPVDYIDHDEVVTVTEIAMFLGPHFVVSVRHGDNDVLRRVRAELDHPQDDPVDGRGNGGGDRGSSRESGADGNVDGGVDEVARDFAGGPAVVLYRAADLVVDGYDAALQGIDVDIDQIETQVFGPGDDDHAERIYKLKQEVGEFRRAVLPLARPLERLAAASVEHVPAATAQYFRDVHDHLLRAADEVEGIDRQLTDVLQANTARVTTGQSRIALRQNEDTRKISAWAAIALVPTAIAGIYGMNFDNMPELRWRYGYFIVLGVIVTVCVVLHRMFRRRGWL